MVRKFIRPIIAALLLVISVLLFIKGFIFLGVLAVLFSGVAVLLHFKNENNLVAFYYVRKNNLPAAGKILQKVKKPELMIKSQEAYYYYLMGMVESQERNVSKAEKSFKKALATGLRMKNDQAVAKLSLSGIYLSRRNKVLATRFLQEAKALDKQKMLTAQIKEIEAMLKKI